MLTASVSSWTPGRAGGDLRGVIDDIVDRGNHTSGTRVWRCRHHHPDEPAALACAQRRLVAMNTRRFSQAQLYALSAMADARASDDQSWIRANTLRSLRGLWWEQNGTKYLNSEGSAAFEAAGGYEAAWGVSSDT